MVDDLVISSFPEGVDGVDYFSPRMLFHHLLAVSIGSAKDTTITRESACRILYLNPIGGEFDDGAWPKVFRELRQCRWKVAPSGGQPKDDASYPNGNHVNIMPDNKYVDIWTAFIPHHRRGGLMLGFHRLMMNSMGVDIVSIGLTRWGWSQDSPPRSHCTNSASG